MAEAIQGLADAYATIDALPVAADREMGKDLVAIGALILSAQQAAVPEDTGALKAGLSVQLMIDRLRVRVGLIGSAARSRSALRASQRDGKERFSFGSLFYGVIVNFGRKAQVVPVERRRIGAAKLPRNRRKRTEDIAIRYSLPVKAMEGREFIDPGAVVDRQVDGLLADFWARSLAATPGGN